MKIWYQSAVEMSGPSPYWKSLEQHIKRVAEPDTQVDIFGVDPGTWGGQQPSQMFGYPAIFHAALGSSFLRAAVRAERNGYDAFIIGTYIEPYLRELRSAVSIPVISNLEATVLVGCSTAHTIGLVTLNQSLLWSLKISLERHRLMDRIGPMLVMSPELNERELIGLLAEPGAYLPAFLDTVRRAASLHADAIIPAEGILAEFSVTNGVTNVDGATVLDGVGIPLKYAEMMVKLWRATNLRTGRRWHYAQPSPEIIERFVPWR